ncbi:hypothetical protein ONE63_000483 [Megalurothrips usitatus]|uniref:Uncharacterized protein n=1 Tax=Megalurothrips usitatus TaxID=439358 RepID=A0AAV7XZ52_9NEOP|nr:hypothetical protein ONE63_000483 [Megalurothrips usitatus]
MAGSPGSLKNALEDWMEQNISSEYTSCIRINGKPILPPLMSEQRRMEMRRLRELAIEVESRMTRRKENNIQEDCAGGEAMYEGTGDELHFANSLPSSLAANPEVLPTHHLDVDSSDQIERDCKQISTSQAASEMLKEFDPLVMDNFRKPVSPLPLLDLNSGDFPEKLTRSSEINISKPGSADSSIALSYSTDLNNYMDITEGSVDISVPGSDVKSAGESGNNTPSTVRPDSTDSKFLSSAPWKDGKATYEDLNNYLDSLLNNSSGSKKNQTLKDSNENVVTSSASPTSRQTTVSSTNFPQASKQYSSDPPPLTSPQGCLQTRVVTDNNNQAQTVWKGTDSSQNSADFLQSCALSPVVRSDVKKSYEEKVQQYLQNLVINEGTVQRVPSSNSSQNSQTLDGNCEGTFPSKTSMNGVSQLAPETILNGFSSVPPRLVRSNSYTLDSPSPMLVAHMEAELRKNVRNDSKAEVKNSSHVRSLARRVWDVENSKDMPSWCTRQTNTSANSNSKPQSPKKVFHRSNSAQPNSLGSLGRSEAPVDISPKQIKTKVAMKNASDQSKARKSSVVSSQKNSDDKVTETVSQPPEALSDVDSQDKVRTLLLQLQLQHNQEMEQLLIRQRKEKEAIRLALLEEQRESAAKSSAEVTKSLVSSQNPDHREKDLLSQSPPTKDKVLMERRNTSPSLYEKDPGELRSHIVLNKKNSSISLEDVPSSGGSAALIYLGCDEKSVNNQIVPYKLHDNQSRIPNSFKGTSDMISSFPPRDHPHSSQLESMTSSLPPEILSLQFLNTELTFNNENTVSCKAQSSSLSFTKPVSSDVMSVAQNILSSAFASNGSPRTKRRSWCSRQLFPEDLTQNHPDWVTQSYDHQAAARIQAGVRGYLTRRLLKTERVQNCITTIRDTIVCALQLQRECAPNVEPSDLQLHGRLIQQLIAACEDLHSIFMSLSVAKRMSIIAADRERLRVRTPRSGSSTGSRPLSRATQLALQRRMNQTDPSDNHSVSTRASSANRSRRRSWAPVESRARASVMNAANNCEVVMGCLSRSSAPVSLPLQRSASAGSSRKPWR